MGILPKNRDLTQSLDRVELEVDASFFRVQADGWVMRLDHFLAAHMKWRSRNSIQDLIRDGSVLVDGSTPDRPHGSGRAEVETRPGRKLRHGSRVTVMIPEELRIVPEAGDGEELVILYEDEEVLAIDKPPMVPVHPSGRHLSGTLVQRVHAHFRDEIAGGRMVPRLCHRLDRETSGIVLLGKRPRTHGHVMAQFEERRVEKEYQAIVWGEAPVEGGTIDYPLAPATASRIGLKMAVRVDGLPCKTVWRGLEAYEGYTLLGVELHTGRQHQIRVHLSAIGFPIVGDKLYGPDEELFQRAADGVLDENDLAELELPRQALHNHRLVFRTPAGGREVEVKSPLPADLRGFLDRQQQY